MKWVVPLGSRTHAGPVVADGRVFIGTNNDGPRNPAAKPPDKAVLLCLREADGKQLWQRVTDKLPDRTAHDWPRFGVCSTPAVVGDRLYYVTNRAEVTCLNVADGNVVWSFDMMAGLKVQPHRASASSPLVVGDAVFVVTGNGSDSDRTEIPAPDTPSFLALNRHTGRVLWHDNAPGKDIIHGQWSSPALADVGGRPQVIFPGGDGRLYAFEPGSGKRLWTFDLNPPGTDPDQRNFPIAPPVVAGGRIHIGTGQNPEMPGGAADLWSITPQATSASAAWHVGGTGPAGRRFGRTVSSCAVHDGLVYAVDVAGMLRCFDAGRGTPLWQHDLTAAVWASPLWADGKVFVVTTEGDVFVFRHGRTARLLNKVEMGEPIHCPPVAANGVLYIATASHLYAIAAGP